MRDIPFLDAASLRENHLAYRARTRRGAWLLVLAVAGLTWLGAGWGIPYAGLAALLLTFGGGLWLARRRLLLERAHWQKEPIVERRGPPRV
jgi:hypothetical protein